MKISIEVFRIRKCFLRGGSPPERVKELLFPPHMFIVSLFSQMDLSLKEISFKYELT